MLAHQASAPTHRTGAARKPEGTVGFAPISARPVLHVAPLRASPVHLILAQIRLVRMIPSNLDMLLAAQSHSHDTSLKTDQKSLFGHIHRG